MDIYPFAVILRDSNSGKVRSVDTFMTLDAALNRHGLLTESAKFDIYEPEPLVEVVVQQGAYQYTIDPTSCELREEDTNY